MLVARQFMVYLTEMWNESSPQAGAANEKDYLGLKTFVALNHSSYERQVLIFFKQNFEGKVFFASTAVI